MGTISPLLKQFASADVVTPGQLYVWANLCKYVDDREAAVALTTPVTELIERYAARAPYHVQLDLVEAANHCLSSPP